MKHLIFFILLTCTLLSAKAQAVFENPKGWGYEYLDGFVFSPFMEWHVPVSEATYPYWPDTGSTTKGYIWIGTDIFQVSATNGTNATFSIPAGSNMVWSDADGNQHSVKWDSLINKIPPQTPIPSTLSAGSRSFNTGYQLSTTKATNITVSASVAVSIGILGSVNATVWMEISPNNSTWTRVGLVAKNAGSLVGLNTTNGSSFTYYGLPKGWYWRAVSSSTISGLGNTATFTFEGGSQATYQ